MVIFKEYSLKTWLYQMMFLQFEFLDQNQLDKVQLKEE